MFAVIKTGGKQYKVSEKQMIRVEKLTEAVGEKVTFNEVLLVADENGKDVKVGKPTLAGASVEAKVISSGRAKKITVLKYKSKVRYRKKKGHRQPFTEVLIEKINA